MGAFWERTTQVNYGDLNFMTREWGGKNRCVPGNATPYDPNGPFRTDGFVLPNCTGYVHGRLLETLGSSNLSIGNANTYFNYNDEYERGSIPKLGAVACWNDSWAGHVAIVERVNTDGSFYISESGWGPIPSSGNYVWFETIPSNGYKSGYTFQGFIYPPYDTPGPTPTENKKHKFKWVLFG